MHGYSSLSKIHPADTGEAFAISHSILLDNSRRQSVGRLNPGTSRQKPWKHFLRQNIAYGWPSSAPPFVDYSQLTYNRDLYRHAWVGGKFHVSTRIMRKPIIAASPESDRPLDERWISLKSAATFF